MYDINMPILQKLESDYKLKLYNISKDEKCLSKQNELINIKNNLSATHDELIK